MPLVAVTPLQQQNDFKRRKHRIRSASYADVSDLDVLLFQEDEES